MFISQLEYALDDSILTQRTLRLRIGAEDVALFCNQAAAKLKDKAVVPGFRKGKAPLARVKAHLRDALHARVFEELKSSAIEQVFAKLDAKDKPLIPPEVLERDKVHIRDGKPLEFAVKYLIDPSAISSQPEQPDQQGALLRGNEVNHPVTRGMGIPMGPDLPLPPLLSKSLQ
jgi:FKBP-type peptidyl-prolyl cis-trans isomerase (trigger factor)